ncbi:uncharacterized protein LOC124616683 isoform X1 [Schistocerca americana]|uniref:uncharacterized protein LOC124616683 isoform X1 n=2 Tax=Schistocerca americana TaxID=7009 RepID=UPI001F4FCF79|nr:uncharacterized protein LOC124616683 isoform X1 [Schistocerca americana]XP_047000985.1 uncharacterized protein LOC124616683 isoform X1 [Schistocerca americana]
MTAACCNATRRRAADTLMLLLLFLPLLNVTSGTKETEEEDVYKVLLPSSQTFLKKHVQAISSYQDPKAVKKENSVAIVNRPGVTFVHKRAISSGELDLLELNSVQSNNGHSRSDFSRKASVFHEQFTTPLSADPDKLLNPNKEHPSLQVVNTAAIWKNVFETSANAPVLKKVGDKSVFLYNINSNTKSESFNKVDSEFQYGFQNKNSHSLKKNKRSVITLGDSETVQTADCVNRSSVNSTCGNDGRFNFVPGSDDSSRTASNIQLNNTSSDRNRKSVKDFSMFSQSRLTLPFQKKKLVDITDSSMGYRSPSTIDSSQKHQPPSGNSSETSATASRSINISYSIPSVKSAGRLSATTIPPEGLDAASITGITVGLVVFLGIVGAMCFILYKRRNQNKPQTLSDKSSNPDSSVYIEESSDDSEEMYSLDNDSFLNSLEAMTIQNYWTENVKHTKL